MHSRYLMPFKYTLFYCLRVVLISALFTSAHAADLSGGLKGLRIGMTKSEAFTILKDQEERAGGFFAPACELDALGEGCTTYMSHLTYGNVPLLKWAIHFEGVGSRLDEIQFFLSKEGCAGKTDVQRPHPRIQFETLSARLAEHYGTQSNSIQNAKVWVDNKIKAGLVLSLYTKPLPGIGSPDCPIVFVKLITEERNKIINQATSTSSAKEKDL